MVLRTLEAELHLCTHYFSVFAARTHVLHLQSEKIWSLLFLKHTQLCNCRCCHPQAFANLPIPVNQSSLKSLSLPGVRRILLQVDFTSVLTTVYPHNLEPFKNLSRPRLFSSPWPPFRLPLFFPPFLSLHARACNPFFMLSLYSCSPFYFAPRYLRCPVFFSFSVLSFVLSFVLFFCCCCCCVCGCTPSIGSWLEHRALAESCCCLAQTLAIIATSGRLASVSLSNFLAYLSFIPRVFTHSAAWE